MLETLDRLYSGLKKRNKLQSLCRFLIREFASVVLPIYFKAIPGKHSLDDNSRVIVSFTSFPARISKLWLVVECLLRQSHSPKKIILWLSEIQFPNGMADIPENLLEYLNRDLMEIRFVDEDLRSHKKYYYALQEFPQDIIVTVDDDLFYTSNTIRDLVSLHYENPDCVCCLRGYDVKKIENKLAPYRKWPLLYNRFGPSSKIFHTSGGGTLYKKSFFPEEVFNKKVFRELCFSADDVWLNIMLQINGTRTIKANFYSHLLPVKSESLKLSKQNVYAGGNDQQIRALIDYYNLNEAKIFE